MNDLKINVAIIGGGMITYDQLLPSIYHLQRIGIVAEIKICALNSLPLKILLEAPLFQKAFPKQSFKPYPLLNEEKDLKKDYPNLYKEVIRKMKPYNAVVVAVPDDFHYPVIMEALNNNQHVLTVKPLVLKYSQATEIEKLAKEKGLFVGIEYHKRFDRRSLEARKSYRESKFGEFMLGEAKLIEPWYYRHSNFQNWFLVERTDPFTYIGCHYVDLVYFITGLLPSKVWVQGKKGKFPNGNVGFLWSTSCIEFENGALLSVLTGLGYADKGAGSNDQNMTLFCEEKDKGGIIKHDDQFRGVIHCYADNNKEREKDFHFINPDFFRLIPWEGDGFKPVGYGYDSVEASLKTIYQIVNETNTLNLEQALSKRKELLKKIDEKGLIATPTNSYINELVIEAGRLSILSDGMPVEIIYQGEQSFVRVKS